MNYKDPNDFVPDNDFHELVCRFLPFTFNQDPLTLEVLYLVMACAVSAHGNGNDKLAKAGMAYNFDLLAKESQKSAAVATLLQARFPNKSKQAPQLLSLASENEVNFSVMRDLLFGDIGIDPANVDLDTWRRGTRRALAKELDFFDVWRLGGEEDDDF